MLAATTIVETLAVPTVRAVFDGATWHSGTAEPARTEYVTPALFDGSCGIAGYREDLTTPLVRAPRAIIALLEESGVGGIRVSSSSWAEHWLFAALLAGAHDLVVLGGGPVLVDHEPVSDRQRWVRDGNDLGSALDLSLREGCRWVGVQTEDAGFCADVVAGARRRGLRVALRGAAAAAGPLQERDLFCGFFNLLRSSQQMSAVDLLVEWGQHPTARAAREVLALIDRGVMVSTDLLNLHRTVFIRQGLQTPFLEENEPILPHVRWALQMRRGSGYMSGRAALKEHTGLVEPKGALARQAEDGWSRLVETAAAFCERSEQVRPTSSSPQLTQVPGFALKEELAVLAGAGVGAETLLRRTTDTSVWDLALPDRLLATSTPPSEGERFWTSLRPVRQVGAPEGAVGSRR